MLLAICFLSANAVPYTRVRRSDFSSPCQYDEASDMTLNAPILPVDGTCGPRHRSSQFFCGMPVAYQLSLSEAASMARWALSSLYLLPSPLSFDMPSLTGIS